MNHPSPSEPGIFGRALQGGSLQFLRKIYRWFNLSVIQHAIWPVLVAVFAAPQVSVADTPWDWYLGRVAGPLLAFVLALGYIRRAVGRGIETTSLPSVHVPETPGRVAQQARYLLLGLPVMVLIVRAIAGPIDEVLRVALLGLCTATAYHAINFWIVPLGFPDGYRGVDLGTILFAVSWGLGDVLRVGASSEGGNLLIAFLAGFTAGLLVALACRGLRRWPGGTWTAPMTQWLVITLILGFVGQ
ncbi:MAG: hypothetical protein KC438_12390 [Thermomicrobiales bacterium]|nr:hypothetical protein [Thermomicrobiales bacterium]